MHLSRWNKNIYGLGVGSEWFLKYKALNEVKRGRHAPRGTPCQCHRMCLSIRKNYIYGLVVGICMVSDMLGFLLNKGGGAWPQGVPGWCHWMCLSIRIWLRGVDLKVSEILGP